MFFVGSYVIVLLLIEPRFFLGVGPEKAENSPSVFASIFGLLILWIAGRLVISLFRRLR